MSKFLKALFVLFVLFVCEGLGPAASFREARCETACVTTRGAARVVGALKAAPAGVNETWTDRVCDGGVAAAAAVYIASPAAGPPGSEGGADRIRSRSFCSQAMPSTIEEESSSPWTSAISGTPAEARAWCASATKSSISSATWVVVVLMMVVVVVMVLR